MVHSMMKTNLAILHKFKDWPFAKHEFLLTGDFNLIYRDSDNNRQ